MLLTASSPLKKKPSPLLFSLLTAHQPSPLLPVTSAVADINRCIGEEGGDPVQTELALQNEFSQLGFLIDESCAERYHVALQRARQEKGEVRSKWVG